MLTLGLDVGTASIGWALIESSDGAGRVVAAGVRVFPEGVDRDQQGGEKSKSQSRRVARGMRRQIARRRNRKAALRSLLAERGLLPSDDASLDALMGENPYALRARAVEERLEPFEIGRVLLHLAQRRGFLSNRKTDRGKEERGMLAEISTLQARIEESGCRTLGQYLHRVGTALKHTSRGRVPTDKERQTGTLHDTIRRNHTRRGMYVEEFEAIWTEQRRHHPSLLTDELHRMLYQPVLTEDEKRRWVCRGLIFGQRRMYWPKDVVGRCELEPKHKRCLAGERAAQRFRILQEVNNLTMIDRQTGEERRLSPDERATLIGYLGEAKERTFDQIRKKLGFSEHARFNLEGPDRLKLKGHETDAALSSAKAIGKKAWAALDERIKDAVARIVLEEDREEEGLAQLMALGLTQGQAQGALSQRLPDARSSLSLEAIERLLPHLEAGKFLMGKDASDSAIHAAGYLRPDEREVRQRKFLPPAPDLPNPLVRQAMVEVRKVVNAILREVCDAPAERGGLGGQRPDAIHIELAREAKRSLQQRTKMRIENAERQRDRDGAAERIREHGVKPTRSTIQKYLLWNEQGGGKAVCPYTGRPISLAQLLSDATDVDHILPRWRSLDDSMMNKVVCFREANHEKGQRTPREWLAEADPARWERVLSAAGSLPYPKFRRFLLEDLRLDDFVNRQLQDTAYIARATTQYLRCLGIAIVTPRGGMAAELRRFWGLNGILSDDGEKNRQDHRHHAVDAAVIALTDRKRLHALANDHGDRVVPPWPGIRDEIARVVLTINVSHRSLRRIRGALHEDTFYGPTHKPRDGAGERRHAKDWVEDPKAFVRRKPVAQLTDLKHLSKVRDKGIRSVLTRHLDRLGVDTSQRKGALPKRCFEGENEPRMPSGVPIRRVRMLEEGETFRPVSVGRSDRRGQFVKPGSNHHVVYRARRKGDTEVWEAEVVTMWDAAARARRDGRSLVDRQEKRGCRFIMSLSIGEAFQIKMDGDAEEVCIVQKLDQRSKRLYYKPHTDARSAGELRGENLYLSPKQMQERHAKKVLIDPLGRIRWAND